MRPSKTAPIGPSPGRVGIFWFHKGRLIARPIPLEQAETRSTRRDSPDAHVRVWPRLVARHAAEFPILSILEYDEVPRGRVIFDTATQTFFIYMDVTLFDHADPTKGPSTPVWGALRNAFELTGRQIRFATDPHYRTGLWDDNEDEDSDIGA